MNNNQVTKIRYRLVTDGKEYFRMEEKYKLPKGLEYVSYYKDKKVYDIDGKLDKKFNNVQIIQPVNRRTKVNNAIMSYLYYGSGA